MKWDRPSLITLVYSLFTILYTLYIARHLHDGSNKGAPWFYFMGFLLFDVYIYFILQGLVRRSKNWDVVLLLPLAIWAATIGLGFLVFELFRIGGFNNKDKYNIDMVLLSLVFLSFSLYAQKWIKPRQNARPARKNTRSPR